MKEVVQHLFLGLLVALIFGKENSFAQIRILPYGGNSTIFIPMVLSHHTYYPQSDVINLDTAKIEYYLSGLYLQSYSQIGDSISMSMETPTGFSGTVTVSIHFNIDTNLKIFRNFYVEFDSDTSFYKPFYDYIDINEKEFVSFSSLSYAIIRDSIIAINDTSKVCRKELDTAFYSYSNIDHHQGKDIYNTGSTDETSHLFNDTSLYRCNIFFVLANSRSQVLNNKSENNSFIITNSSPNHSIHLSFPSSDHSQPLSIYDILGRQVKRIEIPSGVSEYSLPQGQLTDGYYFARLGNMGSKFVVF